MIRKVEFGTINHSTPSEVNGYSDFTNISTFVSRNASYDLSVSVETDGNFIYNTVAWIDWNQNGDFSDPGEQYNLGRIRNSSNDGGLTSNSPISISVPGNAIVGTTRMRITTRYNSSPSPCDNDFDGEVEDYTVEVSAYCASVGNGSDGYTTGITSVNFNTINNSTPVEDNAYSDFTEISTSVNKGETYNLSVNVNTAGDYLIYTRAWFDWNQDGDFDDNGEAFDLGTTQNTTNGSTSNSPLTISIPSTAVSGTTRIRISTKWQTYPTNCETGFDGEVEEYSLNIIESTITTGSISPASFCTGDSVSIPFTITGSYNSGNNFTAQLSNENGSFDSPVNIGSIGSTQVGTINGTIPSTITAGQGYRVRVVSDNPVIIGTINPEQIEIKQAPLKPTATNTGPGCVGSSIDLTALGNTGVTYNWTGPNGFTATGSTVTLSNISEEMQGDYYVTSTIDGCTSPAEVTSVVINPNTWNGRVDSNWNLPDNWSCNIVPTINMSVFIPESLTNYPVLESGAAGTVNNISVETGASIEIRDNSLKIAGDHILMDGTMDAQSGTIIYNGSVAQTIPAITYLNNQIANLIIENPSGVNLSGIIEITGSVKVISGNLNSGGNLTLISTGSQTALIDGSGNGAITGKVKIQRYLDSSFGYKYFSSPFSNTTVGDFSGYIDLNSSFPHFYSYNEARETENNEDVSGWTVYTNAADAVNILEGYALNFGNATAPLTIEISGEVNNGTYSRTLQNSNGLYTQGFNLVGNPYPSPINWNAATGWTKQNIDDAIYFFTSSTTDQYSGTYTSYVNGISSSPVSSEGIIPSMQGFFVKVSDGFTTGNLGLTNEVRNLNFNQEFYKNPEPQDYTAGNESLIRISANFDDSTPKDAAVIYFSSANLPEFEKDKDALKLMNTDASVPNIYSRDPENKKLSINGTNLNIENGISRIPLGLKVKQKGWMQISLEDLENLNYGFIYLLDKRKRIGQNLREQKDFKFYIEAGTFESRFELLFSQNPITDPAEAFEDPLRIINKNGQIFAEYELNRTEDAWLQAINLNGQILDQYKVLGTGSIEIKGIKSSGLYLFTLVTKKGRTSKKVLIRQ